MDSSPDRFTTESTKSVPAERALNERALNERAPIERALIEPAMVGFGLGLAWARSLLFHA